MLQTEYVRSLHSNYERILLEEKPEEKRYQHCILSRGGIKGLLSCSLRYLDGKAYLYYDISSMQNIAQFYGSRPITREWMKDFMWSLRQIRQELERFLLDDRNILLMPEQIFQDVESRKFSFLYIPYYEGESGFLNLVEFWVEHIDYEDEGLVDFVYKVYEQFEQKGEDYCRAQMFDDAETLEKESTVPKMKQEELVEEEKDPGESENLKVELGTEQDEKAEKKNFFHLLESRKRKKKEKYSDYREEMLQRMSEQAVAEQTMYEEDCGRTLYMEEVQIEEKKYRLYTPDGKVAAKLDKPVFIIGKKKEEVDLILTDASASRIHARIIQENGVTYIEDMNSTNGTFKNGLRMQPYEKRKLEQEDEIKIGKVVLIYR